MSFQRLVTLRLSEWISCFLAAVPPRSRRSFLELLCGCLISPDGWVTRALSHISLRCHWTTYYKLLERESLRTQVLAIHFDHSHKHNRPRYVLAQNWVGLALTLRSRSGKTLSFPIRLRLVPRTGNTHKLKIAGALLRAFIPHPYPSACSPMPGSCAAACSCPCCVSAASSSARCAMIPHCIGSPRPNPPKRNGGGPGNMGTN